MRPSGVIVMSACGDCEATLRMRRDMFSNSMVTATALVDFSNLMSVSDARASSLVRGRT